MNFILIEFSFRVAFATAFLLSPLFLPFSVLNIHQTCLLKLGVNRFLNHLRSAYINDFQLFHQIYLMRFHGYVQVKVVSFFHNSAEKIE